MNIAIFAGLIFFFFSDFFYLLTLLVFCTFASVLQFVYLKIVLLNLRDFKMLFIFSPANLNEHNSYVHWIFKDIYTKIMIYNQYEHNRNCFKYLMGLFCSGIHSGTCRFSLPASFFLLASKVMPSIFIHTTRKKKQLSLLLCIIFLLLLHFFLLLHFVLFAFPAHFFLLLQNMLRRFFPILISFQLPSHFIPSFRSSANDRNLYN